MDDKHIEIGRLLVDLSAISKDQELINKTYAYLINHRQQTTDEFIAFIRFIISKFDIINSLILGKEYKTASLYIKETKEECFDTLKQVKS